MFNLGQAITEWRRKMSAAGIKSAPVLDELESHLREDVDQQVRSGADAERAFEMAVKKIGAASALRKEFKKSGVGGVLEKLMIAAAAVVLAFGAFLSIVAVIFCYSGSGERAVGFIAIAVTFGIVCAWPGIVSRLPVVPSKHKRELIKTACLAAGIALGTLYVQIIAHWFQYHPDGMLPAVGYFGLAPVAAGFALAAALELAERRARNQIAV